MSSHSHMDKPKEEPEAHLQKEGEIILGLDEKESEILSHRLTDLLSMGWTLVPESCPLESCRCPLLKSPDGNLYCVRCEMWQFPNKEKKKQKYTDLVVKQSQELSIKETALAKLPKKMTDFSFTIKENMLNALRVKLAYLSSVLNDTTDLNKTKQILENIELCVKDIKIINESL